MEPIAPHITDPAARKALDLATEILDQIAKRYEGYASASYVRESPAAMQRLRQDYMEECAPIQKQIVDITAGYIVPMMVFDGGLILPSPKED